MKAIHNVAFLLCRISPVVLYPKDTEKWKQFTTISNLSPYSLGLFCIPKILKNESNSQPNKSVPLYLYSCFVSQRYWKMKAIHNLKSLHLFGFGVVLYPKDTEKWKQFTTPFIASLCWYSCFVSQRYWKMKAIHNYNG